MDRFQYTICLPEVEFPTVSAMCQLLYGSAILISSSQISCLNQLLESLKITVNISVVNSIDVSELRSNQLFNNSLLGTSVCWKTLTCFGNTFDPLPTLLVYLVNNCRPLVIFD